MQCTTAGELPSCVVSTHEYYIPLQLEKGHRSLVSGLLSPLEMIANGYPDPELNTLAGDLRVCIATLGAVWSTELKQAASEGRGRPKKKGETTGGVMSGLQRQLQTSHKMINVGNGGDETKRTLVEEISVGLDSTALPHGKEDDSTTQTAFQQALTEVQDLEVPVKPWIKLSGLSPRSR